MNYDSTLNSLLDPELSQCDFASLFETFLSGLEEGEIRAASPTKKGWEANAKVKQAILVGFRMGILRDMSAAGSLSFIDKDTYPARQWTLGDQVRIVPGGTSVRRGAHLGQGVVMMPPSYVNVGAFVGQSSMVDSNALVGSCAQVGEKVHISAGAQLGGVLEPVGALPVIVEDDVLLGANSAVLEGCRVSKRAVIGAGVIITQSTRVVDLVHERVLSSENEPLTVPEGAVVIPGSRPHRSEYAQSLGLQISTPVIIKYRDSKTDGKTALESALRENL